ncbi:MAG: patatin-like phospholipase family protein [Pseudonocardia sp.]
MSVPDLPFVHGDLAVLRVLLARASDGDRPGARRDGHRVALVVGGGGMRGSYVAGMLHALHRAGLRSAFDEVYGASSGAFSAAAFLVGSAAAGAAAWPEDLASRAFIDLRRLGIARPVVQLDHLIHEVLCTRKPLAWHELGGSPTPLRVVATDTADLTAHTLAPVSVPDWQTALRASACIPLLAGPPVRIDGRRWIDGSVGEPLAIMRALRGGATHVLALLCRGSDDLHADADAGLSLWARTLDRLVPGLGSVAQGSRRYGSDLRLFTDSGRPDRGQLLAIGPARSVGVGSLCVDPALVAEAVRIGDDSAMRAVEQVAARR